MTLPKDLYRLAALAAVLLLLCAGCGSGASLTAGALSPERSAAAKPPPPPPPPAANPEIAFQASSGLMVMNADGSNVTKLYGSYYAMPDWSPDGLKLVFVNSVLAIKDSLYTMNVDGTDLFEVASAAPNTFVNYPSWSPAAVPNRGARIAYQGGDNYDIWLISPEGGTAENITDTPVSSGQGELENYPTWSPDATKLAYRRLAEQPDGTNFYDIWVHDFATGTATRLEMGGPFIDRMVPLGWFDWARTQLNQGKIALSAQLTRTVNGASVKRNEIWIVDIADPSQPIRLLADDYAHFGSPSWSPDDGQLVYLRNGFDAKGRVTPAEIWKMDLATGAETLLLAPSNKLSGLGDPCWK